MIPHVLKILASQSRFQSLNDEIFNIDRFLEKKTEVLIFLVIDFPWNDPGQTHTFSQGFFKYKNILNKCILLIKLIATIIYLSIQLSFHLFFFLSICLSIYLYIYLVSVFPCVCFFVFLPMCLSICISIQLSINLYIYLSIYI